MASSELLAVWEWGEGRHTIDRCLALLAAALPDRDWDELAALPIGHRDALLIELRGRTFGPVLEARAPCAACGEPLDVELTLDDLLAQGGKGGDDVIEIAIDDWQVTCRLPDSRDLASIAGCDTVPEARRVLMHRCIVSARRNHAACDVESLSPEVIEALSARLEAADPLAVIEVRTRCPGCGADDSMVLDPGALIWDEIRGEAHRLLREIDTLARRYGWTEQQILALGSRRRRTYLEMEAG